jgi:drug/metabolite transporter (DMT)-like permease
MRSFLINKNLSLYYWLKKRFGKRRAFWVANSFEKVVLIFGREQVDDRKW